MRWRSLSLTPTTGKARVARQCRYAHCDRHVCMIGKLKGAIDSYGEDFVILDVHGVGYLVHCSARTLQALPAAGEAVELAIETHVREDQIRLFGFASGNEREWSRLQQWAA